MKDLSQGSISKNIIFMAVPVAIGMLVQTLYFLIDLYFVGELGKDALAGVSAAGNATFLVIAFTQILGVGTVALISHAVGRKDKLRANLVFNQSLTIAVLMALVTLVAGYALAEPYLKSITADPATLVNGKVYLFWFIPSLALQFILAAMGSALRATGIVKPTMIVQLLSVVINIVLAPILIAGWFTDYPMGVAGAGLASSIAMFIAVILMWHYFYRLERYVSIDKALMRPDFNIGKKLLSIGFPAGGEFILMFFYMGVIYWAIQGFGATAQAGFGLGSRVMQAIFMPALALAFALPSVVGQNFGAQLPTRVRAAFTQTALMISALMLLLSAFCWWESSILLLPFTDDAEVIAVGSGFLQIVALNFVPAGIIFTCSGMFQGMGNTWPAFYSMASRLILFAVPAVIISRQRDFALEQLWYLSVTTVLIQMVVSLWLVRREMKSKLRFAADEPAMVNPY
jgi:putative MATE family efflux protein